MLGEQTLESGLKFGVGAAHVPAAKPAPVVVVPFGQDLAPFHEQRAVLHAHRALGRLLSRHLQIPLDTTHFAATPNLRASSRYFSTWAVPRQKSEASALWRPRRLSRNTEERRKG
ncbi:hypothetical protein QOT17_007778 [Balamuthia mandrillaris]